MWHGATEGTSARAESNLTWLSCEPAFIFRYGSVPRRSGEQRKTHEISCYEWAEHPYVEVHISDVTKREDFRQVSFVRQAALKTIMGQGIEGYRQAMLFLHDHLAK